MVATILLQNLSSNHYNTTTTLEATEQHTAPNVYKVQGLGLSSGVLVVGDAVYNTRKKYNLIQNI